MSDPPIVASPDEIVGPGIDALVALRPRALRFINYNKGVYARVIAGWRAQSVLMLRRVGDEALSKRLRCSGQALRELASSEYDTVADDAPTKAIGQVVLVRQGSPLPAGVIRRGFLFRRNADDGAIPEIKSATYESSADVVFPQGALTITVPIVSQRAGAHANAPILDGVVQGTLSIAGTLFYKGTSTATGLISVDSYGAAGGSDGGSDEAIRLQARATSRGQYAPTLDAIQAGALRGTGVRHFAIANVARVLSGGAYVPAAFTNVALADSSWASSAEWTRQVQQVIANDWLGFGESLVGAPVNNRLIRVDATVVLRDSKFLVSTRELDLVIQAALKAYFDDRPDWYVWKLSQIRAVIARADRRIQTCRLAAVYEHATGSVIAEPSLPVATTAGIQPTHYWLPENAALLTYEAPT